MLATHHVYSRLALQNLLKMDLNLTTIRTSFLNLDKNNINYEMRLSVEAGCLSTK